MRYAPWGALTPTLTPTLTRTLTLTLTLTMGCVHAHARVWHAYMANRAPTHALP